MLKTNVYWLLSLKRWYAVPAIGMVLTVVAVFSTRMISADIIHAPLNQWDVLLAIFDNKFEVGIVLPSMFCFFTVNLIRDRNHDFDDIVLLRCRSAGHWLMGKFVMIAMSAVIFSLTLFMTCFVLSFVASRRSMMWSQGDAKVHFLLPFGLAPQDLHMAPAVACAMMVILIMIGLSVIGSVAATIAYIAPISGLGIVVGIAVSVWSTAWPTAVRWLPTLQMELNFHQRFSPQLQAGLPTLWWTGIYMGTLFLLTSGGAFAYAFKHDA